MTIDEMIAKKKEYGFSCEYIAQRSGVPFSTVQKVFSKVSPSPRRKTLEALWKFFDEADKSTGALKPDPYVEADNVYYISKKRIKAGAKGDKTLADYLALPEGVRVELIDGVFYDMTAPQVLHQCISGRIYNKLLYYVDSNNGQCVPLIAPTDVQLDCDDKTIVEPDVLIVCDRDKLKNGARVFGAPDFIVEVLSPSNWRHDMVRKLRKYKKAGVKEYWIIDPEELSILVYDFSKSDLPTEYSFDDEVPVGIWDGKCKIDFKDIYEKIAFMLKKNTL